MSIPAHESDLLRTMVREVLRELVPQTMGAGSTSGRTSDVDVVRIEDDHDLQAFARRIASASESERAAIASGAVLFRLERVSSGARASDGSAAGGAVVRIESGPVTERHVTAAAAAGSSIVLGRKAVLTPLARDRARTAGVEITRER